MRILVTGGAGFIGSSVVDLYIANGHEVAVLDNLSTGRQENINPAARFFKADLTNKEAVGKIIDEFRPDIVNHHAAQIDVRKSVENPQFDALTNIIGGLNLLEAARRNSVKKIIYANTGGALYGEPPAEDLPVDENYPIRPICHYGASKAAVEKYLFLYNHLYGLKYTSLRYANVYGPRQNPHGEAGVVAIFCGLMTKGKQPKIFGDGQQTRDYVFVADVTQANLLALTKGDNDCLNIGTGRETTVNEIFSELKKITGYRGQPDHQPERPSEIRRFQFKVDKAKRLLGWQTEVGLEEGLRRTVAWQKNLKQQA